MAFIYLVPRVKVQFRADVGGTFSCAFFSPWRSIQNDRGKILREFVNADSSAGTIISFTERYGPVRWQEAFSPYPTVSVGPKAVVSAREGPSITSPPFRAFQEGVREYAFGRIVWEANQALFRRLWLAEKESADLRIEGGSDLSFSAGQLTYRTESLEAFLYLSILANRPRLRKCAGADCIAPFFFSQHGPQKYCSDECSESAVRAAKLKWWDKNRKTVSDGKQNRTQGRRGNR